MEFIDNNIEFGFEYNFLSFFLLEQSQKDSIKEKLQVYVFIINA